MSLTLSFYEDSIKVFFVSTDDGILSEDMINAERKLEECIAKENIKCITEEECLNLLPIADRKCILVFKLFEGATFERARDNSNAVLMGPRCVYTCLLQNIPVPNTMSPIFTMSMKDIVITTSRHSEEEKAEMKQLIGYMGGLFSRNFTDSITHLVTEDIFTVKYEMATNRNVTIMRPSWIRDVWNCSRVEDVAATDTKFERHKLPVFYSKNFTTTGLRADVRNEMINLIKAHGGIYSGGFSSRSTNILILERSSIGSEKHKAAEKSEVYSLTPDWVRDSVEKGYALPLTAYEVRSGPSRPIHSTPEGKQHCEFDVSGMSVISRIGSDAETSVNVDESIASNTSLVKSANNVIARTSTEQPYKEALKKLNIQLAKKAGLFLDGCNIYVCGFSSDEKEKIFKILNAGGATRYDTIHANISHIIVGVPSKHEIGLITATQTGAPLVTLSWLVESIEQKQPVQDIDVFLFKIKTNKPVEVEIQNTPSPASKKNIQSMNSSIGTFKKPTRRLTFHEAENDPNTPNRAEPQDEADNILGEYLSIEAHTSIRVTSPRQSKVNVSTSKNNSSDGEQAVATTVYEVTSRPELAVDAAAGPPHGTEDSLWNSQLSSADFTQADFLKGTTVCLMGFDTESLAHLTHYCKISGAEIVENSDRQVDYLITSIDILTMQDVRVKAKKIVNSEWLVASRSAKLAVDILYYFKPIIFPEEKKPLAGMIIVISTYTSHEKTYLVHLIDALGAEHHENYKKIERPLLICPTTTNQKYNAAIRWNFPAVSKEWLLECYKEVKRLPLQPYLIGDTISPVEYIAEVEANNAAANPASSSSTDTPVHTNRRINIDSPVSGPSAGGPSKNNVTPNVDVLKATTSTSDTPVLTHKRVNVLRRSMANQRSPVGSNTSCASIDLDNWLPPDDLDTPIRETQEHSSKLWAEMLANETPATKRKRHESIRAQLKMSDEEIHADINTPGQQKRRKEFFEGRKRENPPPTPTEEKKKSTPWTEYKRKFWQDYAGDHYNSPSQHYTTNTQSLQITNIEVEPSQATVNARDGVESIKKLTAFIQGRNIANELELEEPLPESVPFPGEMEFPNSETNEMVGWRDPTEIQRTSTENRMKFQGRPQFLLTCSENLSDHIIKLNGYVCNESDKVALRYTHLICDSPARGSTTLACVVSGKWMLKPSYILESANAGAFLDEELYEWGNPKACLDGETNETATAAQRWRAKIRKNTSEIPKSGAFKGFRVILQVPKFKLLIEAGSGIVIPVTEPYHSKKEAMTATHFIGSTTKLSQQDIKALKDNQIICVNMKYLQAYILDEKLPDPKNFPA